MDSVKVTVNRRQSLDNKYSKKPQSEFTWNNCFYLYIVEFLLIIAFFIALYPRDFAKVYPHISTESYRSELVKKTTGNLSYSNPFETPYCSYNELIDENRYVLTEPNISTIYDETNIRIGGEYYPSDCKPKFSTAILVAFRNREEQLKTFLTYIHNFLRQQKIHYRIFVIEQANDKPFNHAKLINIGYQHAKRLNFPCIILHDVDLLPMNLGNLYVCTQQPRHMSANIDKFRYNLPFGDIFGGVVAIRSKHFAAINGLSNKVSSKHLGFSLLNQISTNIVIFRLFFSIFFSSKDGAVKMMIFFFVWS